MRTAYRTEYGPPEVLSVRELPKPTVAPGEVLIRVRAASVNRTDSGILRGKPWVFRFFCGLWRPKFVATGSDFAGDVEAVGAGVTRFSPGDRVWGFDDNSLGSHAEYMTFHEDNAILTLPEGLTYEEAVACTEGAHYAINFINKVSLRAGQTALVNGGTGAIGSAAIQLLKHHGVAVTAVCAAEHFGLVESLGASRVIDYQTDDFTRHPASYDLVFDAVGKSTFGQCKPLLAERGVYISSELGPGGQNLLLAAVTPLLGGKRVRFPIPLDPKGSLTLIKRLVEQKEFRPVIDRRFPLEQIQEAFRYVESGQKIGNVILTLD